MNSFARRRKYYIIEVLVVNNYFMKLEIRDSVFFNDGFYKERLRTLQQAECTLDTRRAQADPLTQGKTKDPATGRAHSGHAQSPG